MKPLAPSTRSSWKWPRSAIAKPCVRCPVWSSRKRKTAPSWKNGSTSYPASCRSCAASCGSGSSEHAPSGQRLDLLGQKEEAMSRLAQLAQVLAGIVVHRNGHVDSAVEVLLDG